MPHAHHIWRSASLDWAKLRFEIASKREVREVNNIAMMRVRWRRVHLITADIGKNTLSVPQILAIRAHIISRASNFAFGSSDIVEGKAHPEHN